MRNKKGFTLVELLLVVVILGIITGISIPIVRSISVRNENKKYTTYMDSMKYSAKLYVNSYQEDLFGRNDSGCAIVTYQQMKEKGLLKDIVIDGVSCETDQTFVKIVKMGDQYSYVTSIGCGTSNAAGEVAINIQLPAGGVAGVSSCGMTATSVMEFSGNPTPPDTSINFQSRKIRVLISSNTGFLGGMKIKYSFTTADNAKLDNLAQEPVLMNAWKDLKVDYPDYDQQLDLIGKGELVTTQSNRTIVTPSGTTDDVYVVLRIDELKTNGGINWSNNLNDKYVYIGPYRVDGTKPVFADTSTVVSSESDYNSIEPKLNISVSDPKFSPVGELRMCTSYDNDTCTKEAKYIKKKQRGYVTYDGNKVLSQIQNDYDGSEHTIYVTVGDAAGNYETKSFQYKIATRYILTYDSNGGNDCDPKTKTATFDSDTPKWGTLCVPTRTGYTFTGWNTKADGSGDTITADSNVTGGLTVYAQWRQHKVTIRYTVQSGETITSPYIGSAGSPRYFTVENTLVTESKNEDMSNGYPLQTQIVHGGTLGTNGLANHNNSSMEIKKTGYKGVTGEEWMCACSASNPRCTSCNRDKYSQSEVYSASDFCSTDAGDCTVELKVNWTIESYTLTYDSNGGNNCSPKTVTKNYNNAWGTLCSPTRDGYTFLGWNTKADGTGSTITSSSVATANVTAYAQWKLDRIFTFSYTGNCKYNDGTEKDCTNKTITITSANWWIKLTGGGTLRFGQSSFTIDIFSVGGGGGGGSNNGGGGGGGYRETKTNYTPVLNQDYIIAIGVGGAGGTSKKEGSSGGKTSMTLSGTTITSASGGGGGKTSTVSSVAGGAGGSKGGKSTRRDGSSTVTVGEAGANGAKAFGDNSIGTELYGAGGGGGNFFSHTEYGTQCGKGLNDGGAGGTTGGGHGGKGVLTYQVWQNGVVQAEKYCTDGGTTNGTFYGAGGGGGASISGADYNWTGTTGGSGYQGIMIIRNHR